MPDIKTRESQRTIKTLDRVQNLAGKTRDGTNEAKRHISEAQNNGYSSENEYAGDNLQNMERSAGRTAVYGASKVGRWGIKGARRGIRRLRNKAEQRRQAEYERELARKELPAPERKALPQATDSTARTTGKTIKTSEKSAKTTAKAAKNTAKTAEQTAKTAEKSAKAAEKAAEASAKAAQKAAQLAKVAAQKFVEFCKAAAKAIVEVTKAAVAAIKELIAAIAAGGWEVLVIILVICLVGLFICSAFGIFAPNENEQYSISYVVSSANNDYNRAISEIQSSVPHDYLIMEGECAQMKEVIAVFAVKVSAEGQELLTLDEQKADQFVTVFWTFNSISAYSENVITYETVYETDENGDKIEVQKEKTEVYLHINVTHIDAEQAAERFDFTSKQYDTLHDMLDSYFDEMWEALLTA